MGLSLLPAPDKRSAGSISRLHLRLPCHADRRFTDRQSLPDYYACPPRLWSPRTRRYAGLISCSVPGLSQWVMGGCAMPPRRDCSYLSRQIYRPSPPPSPLYSMGALDALIFRAAYGRLTSMRFVCTKPVISLAYAIFERRTRSLSF